MALHNSAIRALSPEDYQLIEREHAYLERFLQDLKNACECSRDEHAADCSLCGHEQQTSCQGRLPSFLHYVIALASEHFGNEEAIMLNRPHVSEHDSYYVRHKKAHDDILNQLERLVQECFELKELCNTSELYLRLYKDLTDIFETHDREFDDPFIGSTQTWKTRKPA